MPTVVARFHHPSRDLAEIEAALVAAGAADAHVTGYTIAITINADSREHAAKSARELLDKISATHIKVTKHRGKGDSR